MLNTMLLAILFPAYMAVKTARPSRQPTLEPSLFPTYLPSLDPASTMPPSIQPTSIPSNPTRKPTTYAPSKSKFPTSIPSNPTNMPLTASLAPLNFPTNSPESNGANQYTNEFASSILSASSSSVIEIFSCQSQGFDYFDSAFHQCGVCLKSQNQGPDMTVLTKYGDPLGCKCLMGSVELQNTCANDQTGGCSGFTCSSCQNATASYRDNSACVPCGPSTTGFNTLTRDCACPQGQMLQESNINGQKLSSKQCLACPTGTLAVTTDSVIAGVFYQGDLYSCRSCPDPQMTMKYDAASSSYTCSCATNYIRVGDSSVGPEFCILASLANNYDKVASTANTVTYYQLGNKQVTKSLTFSHYFTSAATYCASYGGSQDNIYCQQLANLCLLQLYDDSSAVCQAFQSILTARGNNRVNSIYAWGYGMPWLSYASSNTPLPDPLSICEDTGYKASVTSKYQQLQYILIEIAMNGTFLGYANLNEAFAFCQQREENSGSDMRTDWLNFGTTVEGIQLYCDLSSLQTQPQIFYELYLFDFAVNKLYPVPVRMVNLRNGGQNPNTLDANGSASLCNEQDFLVRRFFLFDRVSGISSSSNIPEVFRVASVIRLDVMINGNTNIYAPVLTIEYQEVIPSLWSSSFGKTLLPDNSPFPNDDILSYTLSFTYNQDLTQFKQNLTITFGIFIAFWIIGFLVYLRWTGEKVFGDDVKLFAWVDLALLLMRLWVRWFFVLTIAISWYVIGAYKIPVNVTELLPSTSQPPYNTPASIYYYFYVMLILLFTFQLLNVLHLHVIKILYTDIFLADDGASNVDQRDDEFTSSGWRVIFSANELVKWLVQRSTNLEFILLFMILVLEGLQYDDDGYLVPRVHNQDALIPGQQNLFLRFAMTSFWFILFWIAQLIFRRLVKYIDSPFQTFNDFLNFSSLAHVAVLILDDKRRGYLLENVEGMNADSTVDQLGKEMARIQLEPKSCFEVLFMNTPDVSKLQSRSLENFESQGTQYSRFFPFVPFFPLTLLFPVLSKAKYGEEKINEVLCKLIYELKPDDPPVDWMNRNIPPPLKENTKRQSNRIENMLWCSIQGECEMLMFNVLSFCIIDLNQQNTAISAFGCYLLHQLILALRLRCVKHAISRSNHLDESLFL